ncbi:hypothetical protein [Blastochloris viridis]|uniref:hypothetical protein n=1 Tax=Blastochloris viridis TaxID=1079 RepID=UPI0011A6DBC1|nr:hypothetical protein [Blastochloris viridis]
MSFAAATARVRALLHRSNDILKLNRDDFAGGSVHLPQCTRDHRRIWTGAVANTQPRSPWVGIDLAGRRIRAPYPNASIGVACGLR